MKAYEHFWRSYIYINNENRLDVIKTPFVFKEKRISEDIWEIPEIMKASAPANNSYHPNFCTYYITHTDWTNVKYLKYMVDQNGTIYKFSIKGEVFYIGNSVILDKDYNILYIKTNLTVIERNENNDVKNITQHPMYYFHPNVASRTDNTFLRLIYRDIIPYCSNLEHLRFADVTKDFTIVPQKPVLYPINNDGKTIQTTAEKIKKLLVDSFQ